MKHLLLFQIVLSIFCIAACLYDKNNMGVSGWLLALILSSKAYSESNDKIKRI